jgi:hypothetical protein
MMAAHMVAQRMLRMFGAPPDQPPHFTVRGAANPYLRRWVIKKPDDDHRIYLHEILRDDYSISRGHNTERLQETKHDD